MNSRQIAAFFICIITLAACGKKEQPPQEPKEDYSQTYFSFRQFANDQFRSHMGSPFVITKYTEVGGKKDSLLMNSYNADWGDILKTFYEADIGKAKFLGKYNYSSFVDETSQAIVHYYEANDPNVYTRTVQIRADAETKHILSIYVEANRNSFWKDVSQKLYYVSMKEIQITTTEKPLIGSNKTVTVDYKFDL